MKTGAIVIGRDYGALGVIRSLGRQGIPVWLLEDETSCASASRYLHGHRRWPAAEGDQLALLAHLAADHGLAGWTLFSASDESAATLARHHALLAHHFIVAGPDWSAMRWAYDKRLTHQLADRIGIANPETVFPTCAADLETTAWRFPRILKPAVKPETNDLTAAKAWRVDNLTELRERYRDAARLVDPATIMIQEMIPGGGEAQFSFAALCDNGRPVAWLTARRTRQYPADFGKFSTFVESVRVPEIVAPSFKLIDAMGYSGVIEIEFKRDAAGVFKPIDINGRYWAWHSLGRKAGVDFHYLHWRLVHGQSVEAGEGKPGVRWMRGLSDLAAGYSGLRQGSITARRFFGSMRLTIVPAIFAVDDLLPFFTDAPTVAMRIWRRRTAASASQAVLLSSDGAQ